MADLRSDLQMSLGPGYALGHELGGGGMSHVFVAKDVNLARKIVVKVLLPELADGVSAERFQREIRVAASLQQANIVPLLATGESNGLPYYTMPFVEGESLRKRLDEGDAPGISEIVRILGDVARALAYAHAQGVVHRDIKPDNVLLSGGTAVVTDFGIAKAISASRTESGRATLTQMGVSLGTPAYMSPEQAAGDPHVDHRADLYAFGCLAYELLARRPPFAGSSPQRVLAAQMSESPAPLAELNPRAPPALASLVMRCLAKDADERPQSAADLTRVLDSLSSGDERVAMAPAPLGGPAMLRRALVIYLGAFVAVTMATQAAIIAFGLPDWVLPGAVIVMLLGLPVILMTAYVQRTMYRAITATPTRTPGGTRPEAGTLARMAANASRLVSWRRTTWAGVAALFAFALAVTVFMVLRALGIGPAGSLISSGKLESREPLLVADFQTATADSALSRVLAEAMRANLGESRVVSLVPPAIVSAGLQRMRVPVDTTLSASLAIDLAQREGIKAVVAGSVTPLSSGYLIGARLVAARSGDRLVSVQEAVDGAGDLIAATDRLSRKLRGRIGESLKDVRRDPPLAQVTTSSLDALKKYAEGVRANDMENDYPKAIRLLEQAIAIDSMFGMAWRKLGVALNARNPGTVSQISPPFEKSYQLRDRMTERERMLTTANYFSQGSHPDRGKSIEAYEELVRRYPEDGAAVANLALAYSGRRAFARAESLFLRRIELDSMTQAAPFNLTLVQLSQGKLDAARAMLERGARLFPKNRNVLPQKGLILYAAERLDSLVALMTQMAAGGDRVDRGTALSILQHVRRRQGKLSEARRLLAQLRSIAAAPASRFSELADSLGGAREQLWFFDRPTELVRRLDAALRLIPLASLPMENTTFLAPYASPTRVSPYFQVASLYAAGQRPDRARAVLAQYDAIVTDTVARRLAALDRQQAEARIALAEGRYRQAIALFRAADRLPDGPRNACVICMDAEIARAFDLSEMPDSAIVAYEHFISAPQPFRWELDGWDLARISRRLGELYEGKGDRARAAAYYQKFVTLWSEADPELQPRVAEIRQRLARLRDVEPNVKG